MVKLWLLIFAVAQVHGFFSPATFSLQRYGQTPSVNGHGFITADEETAPILIRALQQYIKESQVFDVPDAPVQYTRSYGRHRGVIHEEPRGSTVRLLGEEQAENEVPESKPFKLY